VEAVVCCSQNQRCAVVKTALELGLLSLSLSRANPAQLHPRFVIVTDVPTAQPSTAILMPVSFNAEA